MAHLTKTLETAVRFAAPVWLAIQLVGPAEACWGFNREELRRQTSLMEQQLREQQRMTAEMIRLSGYLQGISGRPGQSYSPRAPLPHAVPAPSGPAYPVPAPAPPQYLIPSPGPAPYSVPAPAPPGYGVPSPAPSPYTIPNPAIPARPSPANPPVFAAPPSPGPSGIGPPSAPAPGPGSPGGSGLRPPAPPAPNGAIGTLAPPTIERRSFYQPVHTVIVNPRWVPVTSPTGRIGARGKHRLSR